MKLPNAENAVADIAKFRDYCLNPTHAEGKHKARVFQAALGLTQADAGRLRGLVLAAAQTQEATPGQFIALYGQTYVVDFRMLGLRGEVTVRTAWIVETDAAAPRLTTCYVKE